MVKHIGGTPLRTNVITQADKFDKTQAGEDKLHKIHQVDHKIRRQRKIGPQELHHILHWYSYSGKRDITSKRGFNE